MRIGIVGHNSCEYIERLISIWNDNDSAVLIDYDMSPSVVAQISENAGICRFYIEESLCDRFGMDIPSDRIVPYREDVPMPRILPKSIRNMFKPRYD